MSVEELYKNEGGDWLKAEDMDGKEFECVINDVTVAEVKERDGSVKNKLVVSFVNKEKTLLLNVTNAKTISRAYGDDERQWGGNPLIVFPSTCQYESKTVDCIRVRVPAKKAEDGENF